MRNLFVAKDRGDVMRRLSRLAPASPRQWGKMNPAQMMAHCSAALEVACGDRAMKQALIGRVLSPFVKSSVLGEKDMSRNAPTDPTFKIVEDRDFEAERQRLSTLVDRFQQRGQAAADGLVHSFFGRLSGEEWGRLMYKHLDHHLRQFNA
jgi:uncharacterized protein DUF1569